MLKITKSLLRAISRTALRFVDDIENMEWRKRNIKLVSFWNRNVKYIEDDIKNHPQNEGEYGDYRFAWTQMVWQELDFWVRQGENVSYEEFQYMCSRREFSVEQCRFIHDCLAHMGLTDWTSNDVCVCR